MSRVILIEENIGETRAAVVENGRIVELHLDRWSEQGQRAIEGEVYRGRVRRVETALNAAFIDIGIGEDGFLPFGKAGRPKGFHEGAAIGVRVTREAHAEKGPNLSLTEVEPGDAPEALSDTPILAQRLVAGFGDAEAGWADESSHDLEAAFDEALAPKAMIPGGGSLYIEQTRAMTTIDVDADGRKGQGNAQKMAAALNLLAAKEASRQIRMRGLGGIVAVDFVHMRAQPDRRATEKALRQGFHHDRARIDVAPISQFGVAELARQRRTRSLGEQMLDADGRWTVETGALAALRRLEREARAVGGKRLTLLVAPGVAAWLEDDPIEWQSAMTDRIGPRFAIEARDGWPVDKIDVRAK